MADHSTLARPYAKALFDLARSSGKLAAWSEALNAAAAVLADPSAKRVLASPSLDDSKRAGFIRAMSVGLKSADVFETAHGKALLELLAENGRLTVLPEIAVQFDALKAQAENKVKVTLTSATPADPKVVEQVTQALTKRLGREVELTLEVDAALIGGAIIRAEDMVIDGSVRARLEKLAHTLIDR
jgi:F-type H+-transporting ATPase subunit delta